MRWMDFLCASDRIFLMGGNPYFLSNFPTSMYFLEVVHFSIHGPEICPGNFPEIPSLNPEIPGAGNSTPWARISAPIG
jgi:hypothetical protein